MKYSYLVVISAILLAVPVLARQDTGQQVPPQQQDISALLQDPAGRPANTRCSKTAWRDFRSGR